MDVEPAGNGLRLDGLLRELGAHDGDEAPPTRPDGITVGELVDKAAQAGFGFLVAVLSLIVLLYLNTRIHGEEVGDHPQQAHSR